MGYGPMMWEMTVSIRSSSVSIWDILSLCRGRVSRHVIGCHFNLKNQGSTCVSMT